MNWRSVKISAILLFCSILLNFYRETKAQLPTTPVECGDILQSETTSSEPIQAFTLVASAGTTLNGRVEPLGSTFNVYLKFFDTNGSRFADFNSVAAGLPERFNNFKIGSTNPTLVVGGVSPQYTISVNVPMSDLDDYVGAYTIYLGCILLDGTVINPGDNLTPIAPTEAAPSVPQSMELPDDFFGFPGLPPTDLSNMTELPVPDGVPLTGAIPPTGDVQFGKVISGSAGDVVELNFMRLGGNVNLSLVVINDANQIIFQSSLITTNSLIAQFTLPAAGDYTVAVFRIDLLPSDAPEVTTFQLMTVVNP